MKVKLLIFSVLLLFIAVTGRTQVLMVEDFNYPLGDSLGAHGWVSFSGGATNQLMVTSPGLTYTGYPGSGVGFATTLLTTGQDAYKQFDSTIAGSIYCSFMVRVDTAKGTGDYFMALLPSTSTTNYTARMYAKDTTGGLSFGLSKGAASGGPIVYSTTTYSYGVTYLVVVKYKFLTGSATDDEMSMYVLTSPTLPATEPVTPTIGPIVGTVSDATNLSRIALRQGSSSYVPVLRVDGIRIVKSWSNVVISVINTSTVPGSFNLAQNFPNPFNPKTTIEFTIPSAGFVSLKVYDVLGKEVNQLAGARYNAGSYKVDFSGANLNSGVYYYKINVNSNDGKNFTDVKKLMLIK